MSRHIYTLQKPATWHKELWREALPLGNGLTGVLITGSIGNESIQFNRHDLWEGGGDQPIPDVTQAFHAMRDALDRGDYAAANQDNMGVALREQGYATPIDCPHPLGWLDMTFEPSALFYHYRRGVNMQTGEAFVTFDIKEHHYKRTAFVSRADDVTVIRMTADHPMTVTYDFRLYNQVVDQLTTPHQLYRASKDHYTQAKVQFVGEYTSTIQGNALVVTGCDYMILVRCGSQGSSCTLDDVQSMTYETLLARHVALHQPLYDAVTLELADDEEHQKTNEQMLDEAYDGVASPALLERLWRFGRYLFISAAAEHSNPVPLYGLWHGGDHLAWSQYVANENVEITYWHTMAGGLSYAIPPLLRYYTKKMEKLRECAKQLFGAKGIWISAYTTPHASGVSVPVSVIANWTSCAGWLCRHFWDYYLYTKDEKCLKEEILPFMYEAALFYRDYAVEDGDYIRLYPSVSPENCPIGGAGVVAQNATMDFAIMKELLTNLLEGIRLTGMYAQEKDSFAKLLSQIPPYMINENGGIKEWMHDDLSDNNYHRHLSHIYPAFPGTEITAHNQPKLFAAFKKAVQLRKLGAQSGWSLAHMASIYARMGEADGAVECLDGMAKSVIMPSLMTTHNDWRNMGTTLTWDGEAFVQLDAAFGAVNALQEMVFCWQKEALSILPALPQRLPAGSVCGLVFPEGCIDIAWENHHGINPATATATVTVTVHAKLDLKTSLLLMGIKQCDVCMMAGESQTWTFVM